MQEQRSVRRQMPTLEESPIKHVGDRVRTCLAAVQCDPGNNVFRYMRIAHVNAVDDAHFAEQIIDIIYGGPTWEISDLYEHAFYIR